MINSKSQLWDILSHRHHCIRRRLAPTLLNQTPVQAIRADRRSPDVIANEGFRPKEPSLGLWIRYHPQIFGGYENRVISMSRTLEGAVFWPMTTEDKEIYLYGINAPETFDVGEWRTMILAWQDRMALPPKEHIFVKDLAFTELIATEIEPEKIDFAIPVTNRKISTDPNGWRASFELAKPIFLKSEYDSEWNPILDQTKWSSPQEVSSDHLTEKEILTVNQLRNLKPEMILV